jgi:predicted RNase H-like HicB family nuclease/DNA-binding XRE family transcriptional regulator
MTYQFRVHREKGGYWAECLEFPGCVTQAETLPELRENAREALNLYLDEPEDSQAVLPLPRQSAKTTRTLRVPVEPGVALSVLLRNYRLEHRYTQRQVAHRLGMKNLYSYQRLERRSNPSLQTLQKLKQVFPDLSVDYVLQA